jgi:hypothetical protein
LKRCYQIRDQDFGLAIYEADVAAEALAAFLADMVGAALLPNDYRSMTSEMAPRPYSGGASSTGHMKRWQPELRLSRHCQFIGRDSAKTRQPRISTQLRPNRAGTARPPIFQGMPSVTTRAYIAAGESGASS